MKIITESYDKKFSQFEEKRGGGLVTESLIFDFILDIYTRVTLLVYAI